MTTERQNILDLIPGADCATMELLHEYSQLGLLFTYNIDKRPKFCYRHQIVSSIVILESVADILRMIFVRGILVSTDSSEVMNMIDAACDIGSFGDSSLAWIPRCVSKVIQLGVRNMFFICNYSSLVPIKKTELESCSEMTPETSQFSQFARSQAASVLNWLAPATQQVNNLGSSQEDGIIMHVTDVAMKVLRKKISQIMREAIAPGKKLHREIFSLYGSVASQSKSDLLRFVEFIRYSAQLSSYSFQPSDADIPTDELQKIAVELKSKLRYDNVRVLRSNTTQITATAEKIDIDIFIKDFPVYLSDKITQFQKINACEYSCDDEEMLEAINDVLTSVWSDNIRFVIQSRLSRSLMMDLKRETTQIYSVLNECLDSENRRMNKYINKNDQISKSEQIPALLTLSSRLQTMYTHQKKSFAPEMRTMTDASLVSKFWRKDVIISDVDEETILRNFTS